MIPRKLTCGSCGKRGYLAFELIVGLGIGFIVLLTIGFYHNSQMKVFSKRLDALDLEANLDVAFADMEKIVSIAKKIASIPSSKTSVDILYDDNSSGTTVEKTMRLVLLKRSLYYFSDISGVSGGRLIASNVDRVVFCKLEDPNTGRQTLRVELELSDNKGNKARRVGLFKIPFSGVYF